MTHADQSPQPASAAFTAALNEDYFEAARQIRNLTAEQRTHMANQMDALRVILERAG